jgi:hypothetical protein
MPSHECPVFDGFLILRVVSTRKPPSVDADECAAMATASAMVSADRSGGPALSERSCAISRRGRHRTAPELIHLL